MAEPTSENFLARLRRDVARLRDQDPNSLDAFLSFGWGPRTVVGQIFGRESEVMKRLDGLTRSDRTIASDREAYLMLAEILESLEGLEDRHAHGASSIFVGHGRSQDWRAVVAFLDDQGFESEAFEHESRTGQQVTEVLAGFLRRSRAAVLVLNAEDQTAQGAVRARQNVIHEAGLFQGRLGFDRVALLEEDGVESFSNVAGIQTIHFPRSRIESAFHELGRFLGRLSLK